MRYRVAEAKERSIRDLQERNLYLTISRQRQMILIIVLLILGFSRRRKRMLIEKEEIEILRSMLDSSASEHSEKQHANENMRKLMLQQLGVIKTIAGTPTEANQQLLARLMTLN